MERSDRWIEGIRAPAGACHSEDPGHLHAMPHGRVVFTLRRLALSVCPINQECEGEAGQGVGGRSIPPALAFRKLPRGFATQKVT